MVWRDRGERQVWRATRGLLCRGFAVRRGMAFRQTFCTKLWLSRITVMLDALMTHRGNQTPAAARSRLGDNVISASSAADRLLSGIALRRVVNQIGRQSVQ